MALRHYCPNCGECNLYQINPAPFCGFCGKPINATSASFKTANTIQKAANQIRQPIAQNDDDDYDAPVPTRVPHLDKLEMDIVIDKPSSFQVGQIAASAKIDVQDIKVKAISKKQALADFQKAASSLKRGESTEVA